MILFKKSEFNRNVITLGSGIGLSQIVPFILSPVISRLYTPEDFSIFYTFTSITNFLLVFSTGRFHMPIVIAQTDDDANSLVVVSGIILLVFSMVIAGIFYLFGPQISLFYANNDILPYLMLIPLFLIIMGSIQILNNLSNRYKIYQNLAISKATQGITTTILNVLAGLKNAAAAGLIWSNIIGQFLSVSVQVAKLLQLKKLTFSIESVKNIRVIFKKFRDYPTINILQALVDMLFINLVIIIIMKFFDSASLGHYSLTQKVILFPLTILSTAISQVFFQSASEEVRKNKKMDHMVMSVFKKMIWMALLGFLVLFIGGPILIPFIFGDRWLIAGELSRWLSFWFFMQFLTAPLANIPLIVNELKGFFIRSLIIKGACLAIFFITVISKSDYTLSISVLSLSSGLGLVYMISWFLKLSKEHQIDTRYQTLSS